MAHDLDFLSALQNGSRRTGELAEALGISPRAVRSRASKLRGDGLIDKPQQGVHRLTEAGRRQLAAETIGVEMNVGELGEYLERIPAEHLRAFVRLILSGLVAKVYLFDRFETNWPSFIVGGPTGTGKTLTARILERMLGLSDTIRHVQTASVGELIGRRYQDADGWHYQASPYFGEPFVCLDEWDKAEGDLRRQSLYYVQGDRTVTIEGEPVEIHTTPLLTLNTSAENGIRDIPDPYLRRSVVLDTALIKPDLGDLELEAGDILDAAIQLEMTELTPKATNLDHDQSRELRDMIKTNVTDEGAELIDLPPTVILALGRSALTDDLGEGIYQTAWDRLLCAETLGHTLAGWRERIAAEWRAYREQRPEPDDLSDEAPALTPEIWNPPAPAEDADADGTPDVTERSAQARRATIADDERRGEFIERRQRVADGFAFLRDQLYPLGMEALNRKSKSMREKLQYYEKRCQESVEMLDYEALEAWEAVLERCRDSVKGFLNRVQTWRQRQEAEAAELARLRQQWAEIDKIQRERKKLRRKTGISQDKLINELDRLDVIDLETVERTYKYRPTDVQEVREGIDIIRSTLTGQKRRYYAPVPTETRLEKAYLGPDGVYYRKFDLNPGSATVWKIITEKAKRDLERHQTIERRINELQSRQNQPSLPEGVDL